MYKAHYTTINNCTHRNWPHEKSHLVVFLTVARRIRRKANHLMSDLAMPSLAASLHLYENI